MKKGTILLLCIVSLFLFTRCEKATPDKMLENTETRGKIISTLLNDPKYSGEFMDSMMKSHHTIEKMKDNQPMMDMMLSDPKNGTTMMDKMMGMCSIDPSMCQTMMDKTMDMCEGDTSKCKMMMSAMEAHPKVMESMKGMSDMKGMKMDSKMDMHTQHHPK